MKSLHWAALLALALVLSMLSVACGGARASVSPVAAAGPPSSEPRATQERVDPAGNPIEVVTSVGWDAAPLARDYGLGVPFQIVGFACAKGLPPRATALVRVAGSAGARPALGVEVGADGTVVVPFGVLREGEVVWEFQSITLREGTGYGQLPRGSTGTVGGADQPCRF